jgi:prolyl-tRNA editing enzyme YbaK/EbsC (Cys-tRNA(Pro) deacylase)
MASSRVPIPCLFSPWATWRLSRNAPQTGSSLPFSYDERLELIADPALLDHAELYFNAARLDRSIALVCEDYLRLAQPRLARITAT